MIKWGDDIRRVERYHYFIIIVMLTILLFLENTQLLGISGFFDYNFLYGLKLALWVSLGILVKLFPPVLFSGLIRLRETVISLSFIFAAFHLLCFILVGFFTSFAKSTYDLSALGIIANLVPMIAALISGEMCRSFLINGASKKNPYRTIIFFSLLFALFNMSLGNIRGLDENMDILNYLINIVFPQITQSLAASCLVYLSGPMPAILYLGILRSFSYISPYNPNPSEIPRLLFNVLLPLISIAIIFKLYSIESRELQSGSREESGAFSWILTGALSVAIVWFSVGIFPIFPSVILTGSMEPQIMPGDIVLVEKISGDSVKIGDVVMYYNDGIYITHRIIDETGILGKMQFITKGDNNTNADANFVDLEQIKGRIIGIIPQIGKLALYIRNGE